MGTITGKRKLPSDTSIDGPVTKRRQNPNTPDFSGWAIPSTWNNSRSPQLCGDHSTQAGGTHQVPVPGADTDGETGSSSDDTDADELSSSEGSSSEEGDDDDGSKRTGETASTEGDDDPSEEEEDDDDGLIQNLPARKKPPISALTAPLDLRRKLSSFLPELREANAVLQTPSEARARRLDDVPDSAEHYIQMDLGLGVLKEMKPARTRAGGLELTGGRLTSSGEDSDSDSSEATTTTDGPRADRNCLTDLMVGKRPLSKKPGIQEVPG